MVNKPIPIAEALPTGIDGADVYITDSKHKPIFFIGSLYGSAFWQLHEAIKNLNLNNAKSSYIIEIDYACKLYISANQSKYLKEEVERLRAHLDKSLLNPECIHNLDVLEASADAILAQPNQYIYIIGD